MPPVYLQIEDKSCAFVCLPFGVAFVLLLPLYAHAIEKIVLGYSGVGSGEEVHHFAKEVGLFKKHGLDVEIVYIPGGSTVVQSMMPEKFSSDEAPPRR